MEQAKSNRLTQHNRYNTLFSFSIAAPLADAVCLWRRSFVGIPLAPVVLTFFVLMNITLLAPTVYMYNRDLNVDVFVARSMGVLTFSAVFLFLNVILKHLGS